VSVVIIYANKFLAPVHSQAYQLFVFRQRQSPERPFRAARPSLRRWRKRPGRLGLTQAGSASPWRI